MRVEDSSCAWLTMVARSDRSQSPLVSRDSGPRGNKGSTLKRLHILEVHIKGSTLKRLHVLQVHIKGSTFKMVPHLKGCTSLRFT